ncbi:MAG: N-acetyltransferase [Bacteroidetes bacterium]|nr:MAG: N-acetyltransferase [Bacteroidota bacterium]
MPDWSYATPDHIPELLSIINPAYRGAPSRLGWTTEADFIDGKLRTDAADLDRLFNTPGAVFLQVRDAKDVICGCVYLERQDRGMYLGMLSVLPGLQNQGFGKCLLDGAEAHARKEGCSHIFMQVISLRSELIAWYERHGYAQTGEHKPFHSPTAFGIPKMPLEFVILEKAI